MSTRHATHAISIPLLGAILLMSGLSTPLVAAPRVHPPFEPDAPAAGDAGPNIFLHAKTTGSPHWSDRGPAFAVDGKHDVVGDHWAAENIPVYLTLDLETPRDLNAILFWTVWGGGRYYQYKIEGSLDEKTWSLLVDQTANVEPGGPQGRTFHFGTQSVRYVRTTFTKNSASDKSGGHIVEIEGYALTGEALARHEAWDKVGDGLRGAMGSIDRRYERDAVPEIPGYTVPGTDADTLATRFWFTSGWRGERIQAQLVLWTPDGARQVRFSSTPLRRADGKELPASALRARFIRYVLADGKLVSDPIDTATRMDIAPRSTRPVWISVDIPADAEPGVYEAQLAAEAEGGIRIPIDISARIEVLPLTLPPPAEWSFHLDLWQNPYSVARYHNVEPWSEEHWRLLEPVTRLLAEAGQKCITTTLVHWPWGGQTYDAFESMIEWNHKADGTWAFDYTVFDRYVEFNDRCGITREISGYSMVPWTNKFRYLDEASGDYRVLEAAPGTDAYNAHWRPFLVDFSKHLKEKGWFDRMVIAMDERPPDVMRKAIDLIHDAAPGLKIGLAGNYHEEIDNDLYDLCIYISGEVDPAKIAARVNRGWPTTFYVCCVPGRPNTFPVSPPAESAWMGWHAASANRNGFLRWAYNSWVADPLYDTSHVTWTAGDCFMVYPGGRTSIRFERLREGIQDFEKIRILKARLTEMKEKGNDSEKDLAKKLSDRLEKALAAFSWKAGSESPCEEPLREGKRVVKEISRELGSRKP